MGRSCKEGRHVDVCTVPHCLATSLRLVHVNKLRWLEKRSVGEKIFSISHKLCFDILPLEWQSEE